MVGAVTDAARLYLQHSPVTKGKALVWDAMRGLVKQHPDLLTPRVLRTPDGNNFHIRLDEFHERQVFFWGSWSEPIEAALRRILTPGDVFVDVGANVGYFTILAAKLVGPTGRVLAFEPSPTNRQGLAANIGLNSHANIVVHAVALSSGKGHVDLFHPSNGTLASFRASAGWLPSSVEGKVPREEAVTRFRVQTEALQEILSPWETNRLRLVKIDVEGAEVLVLRGMERLLRDATGLSVICEVCDSYLRELGFSAVELIAYMESLGYSPYHLAGEPFAASSTPGSFSDEFYVDVCFRRPGH
jgi:FkbM family methyltransferase